MVEIANWHYKGYELKIEEDVDPGETIKHFHMYREIGAEQDNWKLAHITPYDSHYSTFELFIDAITAGAPQRWPIPNTLMESNWDKQNLVRFMYERWNLGA